jgi:4-hydroxysphinganine ceramide fatty acyl 2-hydroxylase
MYLIKTFLMPAFGEYNDVISSGFIMGYVMYDVTHYYIHHNRPAFSYWRTLKDYHILHHYKNPKLGFGVSNKLWDHAFNTVLYDDNANKLEFTKK